jgi:ABC-type multidrug transport system ATPase subunit
MTAHNVDWVVRTEALTKDYGDVTAVARLDLRVQRGEIYGLLGPNGAGKTTTIRMLLGRTEPTGGRLFLLGEDVNGGLGELRRRVGVVPERHPAFRWQWMTAVEYLHFFAELYRIDTPDAQVARQLERVDMAYAATRRLDACSRGMLQRLSIARALLPSPEILILDEPISGIDPHGVKEIRDIVLEERRQGTTVLLSSHVLSEVEKLCDRVGFIDHGTLLMESTIDVLDAQLKGIRRIEIEVAEDAVKLDAFLTGLPFVEECSSTGPRTWEVAVATDDDYRADLSRRLVENGCTIVGIRELRASLEDAYVAITRPALDRISGRIDGE